MDFLRAAAFFGLVTVRLVAGDDALAPLRQALAKNREESEHWAFTTRIHATDEKGKPMGDTVYRVDPSKPYAEQYVPIEVEGRAPRESDFRQCREIGINLGKQLAERAKREAAHGGRREPPQIDYGDLHALVDFDSANEVGEDATDWEYRIPLRSEGRGIPVDKIELTLRVAKATRTFDTARLRLTEPIRYKWIFKITEGEVVLHWAVVDPKHSPLMVREEGTLAGGLFFIHRHGTFEITRSDFVRVTPFADRFGVKIGPLKVLPF